MRAVPAPEEYEQDELQDSVAAAMGGAREIRPTVAGKQVGRDVDVRRLATSHGDAPAQPKPVVRKEATVGRNDPCPCGSGKKYKKCHGAGMPE